MGSMQSNHTYKLKVITANRATPVTVSTQDFVVVYDTITPTASIAVPSAFLSTNTLITLSGGSSEPNGVAVATVAVSIQQLGGSC